MISGRARAASPPARTPAPHRWQQWEAGHERSKIVAGAALGRPRASPRRVLRAAMPARDYIDYPMGSRSAYSQLAAGAAVFLDRVVAGRDWRERRRGSWQNHSRRWDRFRRSPGPFFSFEHPISKWLPVGSRARTVDHTGLGDTGADDLKGYARLHHLQSDGARIALRLESGPHGGICLCRGNWTNRESAPGGTAAP